MSDEYYRQLETLTREVQQHIPDILQFVEAFKAHRAVSDYADCIYEFQALMNQLSSAKSKADSLTLPLDHG